jgi:hypothetical protein
LTRGFTLKSITRFTATSSFMLYLSTRHSRESGNLAEQEKLGPGFRWDDEN